MTTPPALKDWQLQLGTLLMGPGTPYDIAQAEGLDELPDLRDDDKDRPGQHGQTSGPDKASGRTVTLELELMGTQDVAYTEALAALRRATVPTEDGVTVLLWFRLPGFPGCQCCGSTSRPASGASPPTASTRWGSPRPSCSCVPLGPSPTVRIAPTVCSSPLPRAAVWLIRWRTHWTTATPATPDASR